MSVPRTGDRCIARGITRDITASPTRICGAGTTGPQPSQGWSDGEDCAGAEGDDSEVVVEFSAAVSFSDGETGITITATGGKTLTTTSTTASGNAVITYFGNWDTPPIAGDTITVAYDSGVGDYNDGVADPNTTFTSSFSYAVDNCLNPPALLSAIATGLNTIVLTFDKSITGDEKLGVTWGGTTPVTTPTATGLPGTTITYTTNETLYSNSVVTWSYTEAVGDITRVDSGAALDNVSNYPVVVTGLAADAAAFRTSFVSGTATPAGASPVGTYTYSRTGTTQSIVDFEGITKSTQTREIGFNGQRRVENLADGVDTQTITVISGNEYQITISEEGLEVPTTVTASGAFTGVLTGGEEGERISWPSGTPKTATTTSLTLTVAGDLTELLVEDVTLQARQVPSEEVVGTEHGTNVENVMYKTYANEITVNGSGLIDESGNPGTSFAIPSVNKGVVLWAAGENFADTDDQNTQTIDLTAEATGDYVFSVKGSASFTISEGTSTLSSFDFTATEASPCNFDMTVAGTVVCTLDSWTLDTDQAGNYLVQLEAGLCPTAFIPSPTTSSAVRNAADLSYDSDNYTDQGWAVCEFDVTQCELDRVAELGAPLSLTLFIVQDDTRFRWLYARFAQDAFLDAVLRVSSKGTGTTNTQDHAITAGHHIISMTWDSSDGTLRQSFDGNAAVGATAANTVMLASEATRFHVGYNFQISDQDWLDGTENSIQFGTGLISDAELVTKSTLDSPVIPDGSIIDPTGGESIVDPGDGTTYIIEA